MMRSEAHDDVYERPTDTSRTALGAGGQEGRAGGDEHGVWAPLELDRESKARSVGQADLHRMLQSRDPKFAHYSVTKRYSPMGPAPPVNRAQKTSPRVPAEENRSTRQETPNAQPIPQVAQSSGGGGGGGIVRGAQPAPRAPVPVIERRRTTPTPVPRVATRGKVVSPRPFPSKPAPTTLHSTTTAAASTAKANGVRTLHSPRRPPSTSSAVARVSPRAHSPRDPPTLQSLVQPLETSVFEAINMARRDPSAVAHFLDTSFRDALARGHFRVAQECRAIAEPLDEALESSSSMCRQSGALAPLTFSVKLAAAARDHCYEIGRTHALSHVIGDSTPRTRVERFGRAASIGETIVCGPTLALELLGLMMVVHDENDRDNVLAEDFTVCGVGWAKTRELDNIVCVLFASSFEPGNV